VQEINMTKTITGDVAMLRNLLASRTSEPEVPAAVTNIREALGVTEVTHPREVAEKFLAEILAQGERDADVAEAKFGTADEIKSHEGVVTKLPEVHDPAGDDLKFHIPAGRATQVLGSREIDISRIPDTQNVAVTDSNGRALPTRSAVAREKAILKALTGNEPLAKLARKYGGKHFSFTMSR
jgi:hypothetical protein